MIISDAFTINIKNYASRSVIDDTMSVNDDPRVSL